MSKFVDSPRFRGGVETKTPQATRKLKRLIAECADFNTFAALVYDLAHSPKYSHRLPKSFDRQTGEPKSYKWVVQEELVGSVTVLLYGITELSTVEISSAIRERLHQSLPNVPCYVHIQNDDSHPYSSILLVEPVSDKQFRDWDDCHSEPQILGVKFTPIQAL